jgi:hypothetical protein
MNYAHLKIKEKNMINISKTKNIIIFLIFILINYNVQSQVFDGNLASKSLKWTLEQKDFTSPPRVGIDPMSIKLWDNYGGTSSPSTYGSLLEINGRVGHLVSQMYFKSTWEGGRILYRSAFYNQTTWDEWRTLLDSKSDVESAGNLKILGNANSYILNGNVGIGTVNPSNNQGWDKVLDVAGSGNAKILATTNNSTFKTGIYSHSSWHGGGGFVGTESNHPLFLIAGYDPKVAILTNGNVGIGTTTPAAKLDIVGDIYIDNLDWSTDNALRIREGGSNSYGAFFKYGLNDLLTIGTRNSGSDFIAFQVPRGSSNVTFNGNVGIGSTNPDQKLTVKGKIHAEEIIVDLSVPADYVFQKYYTGKSELKSDYVMPTLAEIESFTKKNHHLPNLPSAQQVQQNGMSLGQMSNALLQKVEELTLYTIEQNKKLMLQQEELERLKKENENYKSLAERLSSIEKSLKK